VSLTLAPFVRWSSIMTALGIASNAFTGRTMSI
jgi:hypothetical protein